MRRLLPIILLAVATTARSGIDLIPSESEYTAEGITFRQLSFRDGKRRIVYELPRRWEYRADGNTLQLLPPNSVRANASIGVAHVTKPQPFDKKLVALWKEESLRAVPPGATNATVVNEEFNPVRLERGDSYSVAISYQTLGETFVRSTLYVNLPDTELTFRLSARKGEFDSLQRLFRSSILSWHWQDPSGPTAVAEK